MKFTKVLEVDGEKQICIRDKVVTSPGTCVDDIQRRSIICTKCFTPVLASTEGPTNTRHLISSSSCG